MTPLTDQELATLATLLEMMTAGPDGYTLPWLVDDHPAHEDCIEDSNPKYHSKLAYDMRGGTARLAAAAVNALPALLEEVQEARAAALDRWYYANTRD